MSEHSPGRLIASLRVTLVAGLTLAGLLWARHENYLLFHGLVELFSVTIAASAFLVAWNSRRFRADDYLTFLGVGLVAVAALDLVHALAYKGMGVFPGHGANPSTQLWVAGRYLEAVTLTIAPFFLRRRLRPRLALAGAGVATALVLLAIYRWRIFPTCFVEGQGLTAFKRISEYVVCGIILVAMVLHWRRRRGFHPHVLRLLLAAMALTVLQELAFTLYDDPYAPWNLVGHCLDLAAFYLLYKAVVETGFSHPFDLLFRDLQRNQAELRQLNETLEERVALRSAEAEGRAVQLQRLAAELSRAEERERRRLAQVLHDHLQQLLVAAKMRSAAAVRAAPDGQRRNLQEIETILGESIEATRSLTVELSPPVLHQEGLTGALRWLADRTAGVHDLEVDLEAAPEVDALVDEDRKAFLFRAARELLFNAVKHAGVRRAKVALARDGRGPIMLTVSDRGRGYDPTVRAAREHGSGGFGLWSLRERAGLLGGSLEVETAPGAGTRVTVRVPVAGTDPGTDQGAEAAAAPALPEAPSISSASG